MTNHTAIYKDFCDYVRSTFFTPDKKKSNVLMIVDKPFMLRAAADLECSVNDIISAVRYMFDCGYRPDVMGIIAIQIYAASKRANGQGITSRNYRDRLSEVLDIYVDDIASWFTDYQDEYWAKFYSWCKREHFYVDECSPGWGAGRYVQYPLSMAEQIFTTEDLNYIGGLFNSLKLQPGEDISFIEFSDIIRRANRYSRFYTDHARSVIYSHAKSAIDQMYNFYSIWDGTYMDYYTEKKVNASDCTLYLHDDLSRLDLRNEDFDCKVYLETKSLSKTQLCNYYNFKQDDVVLFRRNDLYDNLWEETRYLYGEEEGIALIFSSWKFTQLPVIKKFSSFRFCRVTKNINTNSFYSTPKIYEFRGGLKVGRNKYLYQQPPRLFLSQSASFILDGEFYESEGECEWNILCNEPKVMKIRVVGYKPVEIELVDRDFYPAKWAKSSEKWNLDNNEDRWEPGIEDTDLVGLDFSSLSLPSRKIKQSTFNPLRQWISAHQRATCTPNKQVTVNELIKN